MLSWLGASVFLSLALVSRSGYVSSASPFTLPIMWVWEEVRGLVGQEVSVGGGEGADGVDRFLGLKANPSS